MFPSTVLWTPNLLELKMIAEAITPLAVTVADGTTKTVDAACRNVNYTIQGKTFTSNLRLYPLGGSDVIFRG